MPSREGEVRVFVCDDGSPNRDELLPIYRRFESLPGWTVKLAEANGGKRHAQHLLFGLGGGDLVMTLDSDSEVAPDGVAIAVESFRDAKAGAVVGHLEVANREANLLTRIVSVRYWIAFNQERAAQAHFRTVLCCSGPFSLYRRSVLRQIWQEYVTQTFHGVPCTYGDDRHLTNLVLSTGHDTLYEPRAVVRTNTPTSGGRATRVSCSTSSTGS